MDTKIPSARQAPTAPPASAPALQVTPTARYGSEILRAGRRPFSHLLFGANQAQAQAGETRTLS